jgi:hypothetical protein
MRIVNPSFGIAPKESQAATDRPPVNWLTDPIVFFSNSKPNAKELMAGLKIKLATIRDVANVDFTWKPSAGIPATREAIEAAASKYRIAILGTAD